MEYFWYLPEFEGFVVRLSFSGDMWQRTCTYLLSLLYALFIYLFGIFSSSSDVWLLGPSPCRDHRLLSP